MGKFHMDMSIVLSSEFIEPLQKFENENYAKYDKLLHNLNLVVNDLYTSRKKLKENEESYHQLSHNSERGEKSLSHMIEEYEAGKVTKQELERETTKASELKIYVEESKIKYQSDIEKINMLWTRLFSNFMPFVSTINKSEREKRALLMGKIAEFKRIKEKVFRFNKLNVKVS